MPASQCDCIVMVGKSLPRVVFKYLKETVEGPLGKSLQLGQFDLTYPGVAVDDWFIRHVVTIFGLRFLLSTAVCCDVSNMLTKFTTFLLDCSMFLFFLNRQFDSSSFREKLFNGFKSVPWNSFTYSYIE